MVQPRETGAYALLKKGAGIVGKPDNFEGDQKPPPQPWTELFPGAVGPILTADGRPFGRYQCVSKTGGTLKDDTVKRYWIKFTVRVGKDRREYAGWSPGVGFNVRGDRLKGKTVG